MKTCEKIVKARSEANLTQDQLAELMNVSRQTISKWELDVSLPDTTKLLKLSKILQISIDYLLNDEEDYPITKIPMKKGKEGYEPDWSELYPILKSYESEVDCEHYYKMFDSIFDEVEKRYNYSSKDAMLVVKDLLAKSYFRRIQ